MTEEKVTDEKGATYFKMWGALTMPQRKELVDLIIERLHNNSTDDDYFYLLWTLLGLTYGEPKPACGIDEIAEFLIDYPKWLVEMKSNKEYLYGEKEDEL